MVDLAISLATPAYHQKCGADAFHARQSRDSHNMNWNVKALEYWLKGYDNAERTARIAANQRNEPFVER